jgi:hypothetical protein
MEPLSAADGWFLAFLSPQEIKKQITIGMYNKRFSFLISVLVLN